MQSYGKLISVGFDRPWELRVIPSRSGTESGFGVYIRMGDTHAVCVSPDTRIPWLFDREMAERICRTVDLSLIRLLRQQLPVLGETRGTGGHNYVYFTIPRDNRTGYVFVVTNSNMSAPYPLNFSMKKGALAMLGEIIDVLAAGHVDWAKMSIPPEP